MCSYCLLCHQSQSSLHKESGLALLGMLAEHITNESNEVSESATLIFIIDNCLQDMSNQGRVIISTIRALQSILANISQISTVENYQVLVITIVKVFDILMQGIYNGMWNEGAVLTFLESMIDIADDNTTIHFYESHLLLVFETLVNYLTLPNISSPIKHMILEFFVTLCSTSKKKIRKLKGNNGQKGYFVARLFPICVEMMCDVQDDDGWDTSIELEENAESVTDSDAAEVALDRMCKDLGLSATWSICSSQFNLLLSSSSWKAIYSGLRYLGNYMEVSSKITDRKQLLEHIRNIGSTILGFSRHPHFRVRAACFYCLNQFFLMHKSNIKQDQIVTILNLILESLPVNVNPSPRVRRNVLLCLTCVIDETPASFLEHSTGPILQSVAFALEAGPVMVQELCVSVIMALSETMPGSQLICYYDSIMPILKQLLTYAQSHGLEGLWGQCMMCCAMLGESAGKEKFFNDALQMMNSLVSTQDSLSDTSEANIFLIKAWVRIA
jgi:hypothetical protein